MTKNPHYIKVILDKNGIIVEFKSTLRGLQYTKEEVIGKNWFDTFIANNDKEEILKVFNDLFNNQTEVWETCNNDIRCKGGGHLYIDFTNDIITINGEKYVYSFGVEYINN